MTTPIRLTQLAKRAGCAAKQPPGYLFSLLPLLPPITDPNVLVGSATADDAAIYKLSDELALVLTTDFFTPVVDDPYEFGAVAATNALSDVYAMGGKPLTALSIAGFPDATLPAEVLAAILRGGADKAKEAGIDIVGGHTIKSDEPIYGLAVVGTIHPQRILANDRARPGDVLILTKPLGVGIITTAAKNGEDVQHAIGIALELMKTLNRTAGEIIAAHAGVGVHALTDITGFGLLGHLRNILAASHVSARIQVNRVPCLPAARAYVHEGIAPAGTYANLRYLMPMLQCGTGVTKEDQLLLCDAQTSGGLLAVVAPEMASTLLAELHGAGITAATPIGYIEAGPTSVLRLERGS